MRYLAVAVLLISSSALAAPHCETLTQQVRSCGDTLHCPVGTDEAISGSCRWNTDACTGRVSEFNKYAVDKIGWRCIANGPFSDEVLLEISVTCCKKPGDGESAEAPAENPAPTE